MSVPRFDAIHARIVGVEIGLSAGWTWRAGHGWRAISKVLAARANVHDMLELMEGYIERQDLVSVGIAL